jgi:hypothetical protein
MGDIRERVANTQLACQVLKKIGEVPYIHTTIAGDVIIKRTAAYVLIKKGSTQSCLRKAHVRLLLLKNESRPDPDNQFLTKYNKLPVCITVKCCLQPYIYDVPYVYNLPVKKKKKGKFKNLGEGV